MTRHFYILLIGVLGLYSFQSAPGKKIEVTGKALNAMGGAVVVDAKGTPYYLDGMGSWSKKYYGKRVKVSGILVVKITPKDNRRDPPQQVIKGEKRTIKKAKLALVE